MKLSSFTRQEVLVLLAMAMLYGYVLHEQNLKAFLV